MSELSKKLMLACASTFLCLFALELVTRYALGPPPKGNITPVPSQMRMDPSIPGVPYQLRPDMEVAHFFPSNPRGYFDDDGSVTYRTNALGFRGGETTLAKRPGVYRILGLGDSFTFGTGVRVEDTFLSVAERRLNARDAAPIFEILNLGVMGYDTIHEVALLDHVGRKYDPDLVVICFFLNDAQGGATHSLFNVSAPTEGFLSLLAKRSVLVERIVVAKERRRQAAKLVESYSRSFESDSPGWVLAQRALLDAKVIAGQEGVELVLVVFPVLWNLSSGYPFEQIHETVRSFAEARGIPVLDLLPAFSGSNGPELWVHSSNQHPNEKGHSIAGEALHRFLSEQDLVPRPIAPGSR